MAEPIQQQIERIVHSEQFRSSEVLRRLLTFLSEKAIAGEADNLKEYVVAIDGLGKSFTYDPQHNSAVRIQMGRPRQRLAEYYRTEGKNDPMIVDLPKGRFRLTFEQRSNTPAFSQVGSLSPMPPVPAAEFLDSAPSRAVKLSLLQLLAGLATVVLLLGLGYLLGRSTGQQENVAGRNSQDHRNSVGTVPQPQAAANSFDRRSPLRGDSLESWGVRSRPFDERVVGCSEFRCAE
jgi:hypothetical protein